MNQIKQIYLMKKNMRNSHSFYQKKIKYDQSEPYTSYNYNSQDNQISSFESLVNSLISKTDLLEIQTKRLSQCIRHTEKQLQTLQQENKKLKKSLRQFDFNSKQSVIFTDHDILTEDPSMLHHMSQRIIVNSDNFKDEQQQVSLLDGISQNNDFQKSNKITQRNEFKLDFSTIKKSKINVGLKEDENTKLRGNKYSIKDQHIQEFQIQRIDSQIYSQHRNSLHMEVIEQIKNQLIPLRLFFEKTYGQQFNRYIRQNEFKQILPSKLIFTHKQIESSKNVKEHLTNQNNILRERNKRYRQQLKISQEELAKIKSLLMTTLEHEQKQSK